RFSLYLFSTFVRSGISIRSFHAKPLPFYHVIPRTPHLQSTWGDRHVRRIRSRKQPASSDPARSATACWIGRRLEEEASGARCQHVLPSDKPTLWKANCFARIFRSFSMVSN